MSTLAVVETLVALVVLLGLVGVVVPVLPGSLAVGGAILVWAAYVGTTTAWVVLAVAVVLLAAGQVAMYLVPGRRLRAAGVPGRTLVLGAALGVVGFFVIPVVGLFVGFLGGVYLSELARVGSSRAWPSTVHALEAAGLSMLIELTACLLAASTWVAGVVLT
ncbi:hypothetical protein SAMN04488570_1347 [Nocardioides scoriae]|uniref:DUF456 domain-containing protein n=1 Tax=Nocardioides scoriae TaxID=642780 RepID=A0A1H1Q9A1_9ACTN|nr:DUF456 domain-containing protein [Nocardioides scoriae]SDS19847.1 hypothetical protein SAMN04488570_1347 [Nocardioides scoriae]